MSVEGGNGLQVEMALADEDCAGDDAFDRTEEGERPFVEVKRGDIAGQREIIEAKSLAEAHLAKLTVDRIRIEKGKAGPRNVD